MVDREVPPLPSLLRFSYLPSPLSDVQRGIEVDREIDKDRYRQGWIEINIDKDRDRNRQIEIERNRSRNREILRETERKLEREIRQTERQ